MAKFEMAKDFDKQLKKAISSGMKEVARDQTRAMDRFGARYRGRPVAEIKPALKREWERNGGKITEPELTEMAQLISDGVRVEFRYDA